MNILHINASDNGVGGAARVALDLHDTCIRNGHVSHFLSGVGYRKDDPSFHKIPFQTHRKLLAKLLANDAAYFNSDFIFQQKYYQEAEIVHFHNVHGWYFNLSTFKKICAEKKVIWTLHDMWAITPHCAHSYDLKSKDGFFSCRSLSDYPSLYWPNQTRLKNQKRTVYENTHISLVTPSHWLAEKARRSALSSSPLTVIPNGIDTDIFSPVEKQLARKSLNLPVDKKIVLFIASGGIKNEFKGAEHVLEIAGYTKDEDMVFLCVGGQKDKIYDNIIERSGTPDKLILRNYYSASDVLVFPSQAENFPLVILEAMSCGLPVAAFDVGGVSESITDNVDGLVVEQNNTTALAEAVYSLVNEKNNSSEIRRNKVIKNFSIATMGQSYLDLYQSIL